MLHRQFGKNQRVMTGSYQLPIDIYTTDLDGDGLDEVLVAGTQLGTLWQPNETILDNGRYQGMLIKQGVNYPEGWTYWCNRAEATSIPGALDFLKYAHSRGVRVFYITNRKIAEKDGIARNLKALGFPEVNDETLLVRTDTQTDSKEPRRQSVTSRYHVVLLMGDNLNDFSDVFEKSKTVAARLDATEKNRSQFGTHFLVLPNAMYGDWENAVYDYNFKLSSAEKQAKRRALLKD